MRLLALRLYDLSEADFAVILPLLADDDIEALEGELRPYAVKHNGRGSPPVSRYSALASAAGWRRLRIRRSSGGSASTATASTSSVCAMLLLHRMPNSPLLIDSARRRFCSSISPSTKPRISGDIGKCILRKM